MFPQNTSAGLYDDFNINPSATQEEIEKAWKKRVRSYHPDKHINGEQGLSKDDAHEIFTFLNRKQTLEEIKAEDAPKLRPYKDLKTGFYILMDPTLREKYDEWLKTPDHEKNTGRFKHSAGRSDGRGSDSSGYSGNRAGRQSADSSGLLHAAILSADKISLSWSLSPKEKEERILNIVKTVLEGNININGRDHYGKTALYVAIENSYFRIAEMLLSAGADPNIPDDHGRLPLHCISAGDSSDQSYSYYSSCSDEEIAEEALRLLVQFKADLSRRDSNDKTVIETAMESGFWNIAYMLLDQGAPYLTEEDREILSVMAVQNHQADILRLIRDPHTASGRGILQTRRPKQEQRRDPANAAEAGRIEKASWNLMSFLIFPKEVLGSSKMSRAEQLKQLSVEEQLEVDGAVIAGAMLGGLAGTFICLAAGMCIGIELAEMGIIEKTKSGARIGALFGTIAGVLGTPIVGGNLAEKVKLRQIIKRKNSCWKAFTDKKT